MESQNRRRALRGASALVAGALLALGFATGASASTDPTTIDSTKTGTLNIHKYKQPVDSLGLPNNGTPQEIPAGVEPLADVTFKAERLSDYDLTTNAGWSSLANLTVAGAASAAKDTAVTGTTDANGEYSFTGLALGAYLVTEVSAPAGTTPIAPFVVTLPMTNPTGDSWLYTVDVYPKNSQIGMGSKEVDEGDATKVGDQITWTIKGEIPTSDTIDGYRIEDRLDGRLTFVSAAVSLTNSVTLAAGTDYTLEQIPYTDSNGKASTIVRITLTPAGLEKLAANKTAMVQVDIVTVVNEVGDIDNQAIIYPNEGSFDMEPGEPGGPVITDPETTKFGNVTVKKVAADDNMELLQGATFQVFTSESDARARTNAITIEGVSEWTTDSNGLVTISGLRQSGWYKGGAVAPGEEGFQYYWIVETQAPTGYELLAAPVQVTVGDADAIVDITVENAKHNGGFQLPFTGSALGAGLFYGGGAAILLAVAMTLVIRQRRKNHVEA